MAESPVSLDPIRGGALFRLLVRLHLVTAEDLRVRRRAALSVALTWLPLLVLTFLEGHAWSTDPHAAFLFDFSAHVRFLFVLPMLILVQGPIGDRLRLAADLFASGGYVRAVDRPRYVQAVASFKRGRDSWIVELALLAAAYAAAATVRAQDFGDASTWHSNLSLGAYWYYFVAVPLLLFVWLRWLWRLLLWTRFCFTMSRLDPHLVVSHSDGAGGLGFLGTAHAVFSPLAFALSARACADIAFKVLYDGAVLVSFRSNLISLVAVSLTLFLGPLLFFTPVLLRARRDGLHRYNALVARYGRDFEAKWIDGSPPASEPLLGSADIQSLADMGNSFDVIQKMQFVPFDRRVVIQLVVATLLPAVPLVLFVVPLDRIFAIVKGAVL